MEQKKKPKYEKPEIRELGRAGDDEMMAAAGDCVGGSGDATCLPNGVSAGMFCQSGTSAGMACATGESADGCAIGEGGSA